MEVVREKLAELSHEQWSGWMKYLFSKCDMTLDGRAVISYELVKHWKRQISTPYHELSESEKESDRVEADRILAVIEDNK